MARSANSLWHFHRIGGLDQVTLRTAEELRHIDKLDPKLWVALSCPTTGLEFDERTLQLVDKDRDGRIRIPEVVEAVKWTCFYLRDPAIIVEPEAEFPLDAINQDTPEGRRMAATARAILENLGHADRKTLSREDVIEASASAAKNLYNGDGILPALPDYGDDMCAFITDALDVVGGVEDASGKPGVDVPIAEAFMQWLTHWSDWQGSVSAASEPLSANTAEAWELLQKLKDKIDDYFLRCELASFAPAASPALNASESVCSDQRLVLPLEKGLLDIHSLEELPLSLVEADRPLILSSGVNPAWRARVQRFFTLIEPLLDDKDKLTREKWQSIQDYFAPYAEALARKPERVKAEITYEPTKALEALGEKRINDILQSGIFDRFKELAAKDAAVPAASSDIAAVERLVLYYLHLHRLLMNFVSFYDFFSLTRKAAFQTGVLYLDSRSCRLCLPVADLTKHVTLASFSELCLVYCECRRRGKPDSDETRSIVAAMTAGSADMLMEGRNGVFVDNNGHDWDATVVRIVSNPISLKEAIWQPYRRLGRMISEQVGKLAGSKQEELTAAATKQLDTALTAAAVPPAAPSAPQSFDIGRSVGIFAAIGLALGAIGTALASIFNALFSLSWWQFPLVFLGLFLLVSGPSLVMAWLKLRKRTLSPLLEASGWAVNGRVPINLSLGNQLTAEAELPDDASRTYNDPFKPASRWPLWALIAAFAVTVLVGWIWLAKPAFIDDIRSGVASMFTSPPAASAPAVQPAPAPEAAAPTSETPPEETSPAPQ